MEPTSPEKLPSAGQPENREQNEQLFRETNMPHKGKELFAAFPLIRAVIPNRPGVWNIGICRVTGDLIFLNGLKKLDPDKMPSDTRYFSADESLRGQDPEKITEAFNQWGAKHPELFSELD